MAFYAFCLTVISLITMVVTLRPEMLDGALKFLMTNVLADRGLTVLLFIIELIFFGLSLMFLLSGVKSDKDKIYQQI
ncbi:hypothetical protein JCM21531_1042 [Acetivibrio straminisolvens JCM 21531]|uniref:Uncharacterized protein n=1 Tax=Acetivibrio straminisolvens JCM 21531 TaxID=1294263 RepID=W4V4H8_9FIRM|nr:hypothetical protein JCM21531_1042 [Acetivibrio straminisolvens JCM 21531]